MNASLLSPGGESSKPPALFSLSEALEKLHAFDRDTRPHPAAVLAGVDEVGRGPLAGPVVAAAVIFYPEAPKLPVQDSKKMSIKARQDLVNEIHRCAFVGLGVVDEKTIDEINIYQATRLAMKQALAAIHQTPDLVLIDGNMKLDIPFPQQAIVKGDAKSASIAAASIIAKVYRDNLMDELDQAYPGYGLAQHKGYPTPFHLEKLKTLGPSAIHRRSFGPVAAFYSGVKSEANT